jgi:hypothetical protein
LTTADSEVRIQTPNQSLLLLNETPGHFIIWQIVRMIDRAFNFPLSPVWSR